MTAYGAAESVRHRVAIVGTVVDPQGRPLRRFDVRVTGPKNAPTALSRWAGSAKPHRALLIKDDGTFFVFDLEPGTYRVDARAAAPVGGERWVMQTPQSVKVVRHQPGRFDESHVAMALEPPPAMPAAT